MVVNILDENDNSPKFERAVKNLKIKENTPINTKFELPQVSDGDSSPLDVRSFILEQETKGPKAFEVESKLVDGKMQAELKIVAELDHEKTPVYSLNVIAKDGGDPARNGVLKVQVELEDVNDNAPRFNQSKFTVSVSEDLKTGQLVANIRAFDPDGPQYNILTYSIEGSDHFYVDSNSGNIYLKQEVDAESNVVYSFELKAADNGNPELTNSTRVEVRVTNVNDNDPIIRVEYLPPGFNSVSETLILLFE